MDQKTRSPKFLRHRKFMVVLPVLVLPFVAMIFWSFDGGKGNSPGSEDISSSKGLNTQLPDAVLKNDQSLTKMSFYDQAASDSVKKSELIKTDPFFRFNNPVGDQGDTVAVTDAAAGPYTSPADVYSSEPGYNILASRDPNEEKVYSRIEALNKAMNEASHKADNRSDETNTYSRSATNSLKTSDVDRLEQMMNVMKNSNEGDDPEMKQLNGMLDKIMDIQHPDRVSETARQTSVEQGSEVLAVTAAGGKSNISLLERPASGGSARTYKKDTLNPSLPNGFYPLEPTQIISQTQNAIAAVIHETQSLVSGATIKMRLLSDINIHGVLIPKDNFIYGTAAISDERLKVTIASVRYQNSIFPVRLSLYDMDGMEGIFIPGSISRDVAKSSADQALQGFGLSNLSPSLPVQAAGAGIQAAKSLLSKKTKLVKVSVKAGYQVLLKDAF